MNRFGRCRAVVAAWIHPELETAVLLSEAISQLLIATQAEGRSVRTVQSYERNLSYLVAYLGDQDVTQVTPAHLRRYAADLHGRDSRYDTHPMMATKPGHLSDFSVMSYLRSVKRLFNWLTEEGHLAENPARRLKLGQPARTEPKAITRDDFRKLLQATAGTDPISRRNRAIVLFLADTGARVGGLAGLRLPDLNLQALYASVVEKGKKTRRVFFSEITQAALISWLMVRPGDAGEWVFCSLGTRGEDRLGEAGIGQVLKRLRRKAKITGPCSPHAFRHAFAREWLRSGGDLSTLSNVLGHSDVAVTSRFYAKFLPEELQEFHRRHSPVAKMGSDPID